jgi:hypothetical protein
VFSDYAADAGGEGAQSGDNSDSGASGAMGGVAGVAGRGGVGGLRARRAAKVAASCLPSSDGAEACSPAAEGSGKESRAEFELIQCQELRKRPLAADGTGQDCTNSREGKKSCERETRGGNKKRPPPLLLAVGGTVS